MSDDISPKELSENDLKELSKHIEHQFSVPWQYDGATGERPQVDADGFAINGTGSLTRLSRKDLHTKIYQKFYFNPHVNTSSRGLVGRMAGYGFATVPRAKGLQEKDIFLLENAIEEIEEDYRNRLYEYWPKFLIRAYLSGELFLCFTCHDDGFIEIDYVHPDVVDDSQADNGIIFHPNKTRMPLIYCIKDSDKDIDEHIPSIYIARYPELLKVAAKQDDFDDNKLASSRAHYRKKAFQPFKRYYRFIVSWDLGLLTSRSTSHLLTILEWLNHWENLKKYEIDHKKSSGAYVHIVRFTDIKSWITWLSLSDEQRAKTGIVTPKTPGGTLVLGPNMEHRIESPNLPKISEGDSDIMQMITSGLHEPEDIVTNQARGPFSSVKASRGPMSDRISDEWAYFERWLRFDFWGNIFFLKSKIMKDFPETIAVRKATHFKNKKPIFKTVQKKPEKCIEIIFPTSAIENIEGTARAFLGVKHGSLNDTAGISNEEILKRMGFRGYGRLRLDKAEEDEVYPETLLTIDQESFQEKKEAEPKNKKADSPEDAE